LRLLQRFLASGRDYLLFLEDDLSFNRHLGHNLQTWSLLRSKSIALAGLHNPGIIEQACDLKHRAYLVSPDRVFGSLAFLLSRRTARFLVERWNTVEGRLDARMAQLAGRLKQPIWYHSPSLVQPVGLDGASGGGVHRAADFDPDWKSDLIHWPNGGRSRWNKKL